MKSKHYLIIAVTALVAAASMALASTGENTQPGSTGGTTVQSILNAGAANFANESALVDTAWVQENLANENVRLVDVSANLGTYESGHLPGAVFIDWRDELTNPDVSVEGQILTGEQLETLLSERGIANEHTVVFYDDTSNLFATRAYWVLAYYQHKDVRVYDGGSTKWVADGNDLSTEAVSYEATEYTAAEPDPAIRTTAEYVLDNLDNENVVTCDTRSTAEYTGEDARAERGGHIPGAVHLEWTHAVNEDGTFKPVPELAALFYAEGFTPDKEILTYCQTGVRGAHTWFVLSELLGYPNVRNYDGSWAEWGNSDAPVSQ